MSALPQATPTTARWGGILFGLGTHALFGLTVWRLFLFLQSPADGLWAGNQATNLLLSLLFVIPHSLLLHPSIRDRLTWIPGPFYGCFYTLVTIACLWCCFLGWRKDPLVLWQVSGVAAYVIQACFLGSWVALFYSIRLTGFGWQTGWTPWLAWFRGEPPPRRGFNPTGAYRYFRHPVYLSFLGLLWFSPVMTLDRAILVGTWTVYIFAGSLLKDQRLHFYLGDRYRDYQQQVPGYPLLGFGPWGRLAKQADATDDRAAEVGTALQASEVRRAA